MATVELTETERFRTQVALHAYIDDMTEAVDSTRRIAASHPDDPYWSDAALLNGLRRAQALQAYCRLTGLTPSHFTFNQRWGK